MELKNISEAGVSEYIFFNYPDDLPLDVCRERLELDIYEWSMKYEDHEQIDDVEEDENGNLKYTGTTFDVNEPVISPYYLFMLDLHKNCQRLKKMSKKEVNKELGEIIVNREDRIAKMKNANKE